MPERARRANWGRVGTVGQMVNYFKNTYSVHHHDYWQHLGESGVWQIPFCQSVFWEDVVSMGVIALHTVYIFSLFYSFMSLEQQLLLILGAYTAYVINAVQFLLKLRAARLQEEKKRAENSQIPMNDSEGLMA